MNKYYRNKTMVVSDQGVEIDPGSLWVFNQQTNLMVLVDDDEYHTSKPKQEFIKIPCQKPSR